MTILRFFLLTVLFYYVIKWLLGRFFVSSGRSSKNGERSGREDYSELTDQKIDDVDYEDIKPGDDK